MPRARSPSKARNEAAADRIVDAAWRLFAEHGLEVPLSRIAREARVSPAAMKRCFPARKALVDRVMKKLFAARWKPQWDVLLVNRKIPFQERLSRFFTEYRGNIDRSNGRLWTRAGLLGLHASGNFSATLAKRILAPIIHELRHEAGLPATNRIVNGKEIELAMVLHGALAFPHTRANIFGMDVHGPFKEIAAMTVRVWLPGAKAEIRRLAAGGRKVR